MDVHLTSQPRRSHRANGRMDEMTDDWTDFTSSSKGGILNKKLQLVSGVVSYSGLKTRSNAISTVISERNTIYHITDTGSVHWYDTRQTIFKDY